MAIYGRSYLRPIIRHPYYIARPTSVVVTPGSASILTTHTVGLSAQLRDQFLGNMAGAATWTSLNPSFATVNASTGVVTGVAPGIATIQATINGKVGSATITVSFLPGGPLRRVIIASWAARQRAIYQVTRRFATSAPQIIIRAGLPVTQFTATGNANGVGSGKGTLAQLIAAAGGAGGAGVGSALGVLVQLFALTGTGEGAAGVGSAGGSLAEVFALSGGAFAIGTASGVASEASSDVFASGSATGVGSGVGALGEELDITSGNASGVGSATDGELTITVGATSSTAALYQMIRGRLLGFVGAQPGAVSVADLVTSPPGQPRCWEVQAPDKLQTFPYIVFRLLARSNAIRPRARIDFDIELDVFGRKRTDSKAVQDIGDAIEVALLDWRESTGPIVIQDLRRDTYAFNAAPADREVTREHLIVSGYCYLEYLVPNLGS